MTAAVIKSDKATKRTDISLMHDEEEQKSSRMRDSGSSS